MKRINKTNKKGFTLLEIILVVAMLCILASVLFVSVRESQRKANAASLKLKQEEDQIKESVENFEQEMEGLGF